MSSGVEAAVAVKPSYGLSDGEITQMLKESFEHAKEDVRLRALRENQVEGDRMLEALGAAFAEDADLLGGTEQEELRALMARLREAIAGTDHRAIKAAVDRLNKATEPFAALRMDRSVREALAGKNIDTLKV
jgi:molecular chaperone HscA